jgi:hypothetical protein
MVSLVTTGGFWATTPVKGTAVPTIDKPTKAMRAHGVTRW